MTARAVPANSLSDVKPLRSVPLEKLKLIEIPAAGLDCKACCWAAYESIYKLEEHAGDAHHIRLHYDHLFHYAMARAARSDLLAYYQHQILKQLEGHRPQIRRRDVGIRSSHRSPHIGRRKRWIPSCLHVKCQQVAPAGLG